MVKLKTLIITVIAWTVTGLDEDEAPSPATATVGYKQWRLLTKEQHLEEANVWEVKEVELYAKYSCTGNKLTGGDYIESGHDSVTTGPDKAFDDDYNTEWGGRFNEEESKLIWIGLKFDTPEIVQCLKFQDDDVKGRSTNKVWIQAMDTPKMWKDMVETEHKFGDLQTIQIPSSPPVVKPTPTPPLVKLRTIIITGMVTGSVSAISSLSIIVLILRSRTRFSDTFHRIMAGLSLTDIFLSLAISLGTIPSPMGQYAAEFARGNTSTCDAQGFFYIFGAASAPLYAIALQLYFLLRIKYNIAKEKLVKNVEPYLHAAPIVYGLIVAIVALSLGSINALGWGSCYIVEYPSGCKSNVVKDIALNKNERKCLRGDMVNPRVLRWVIFGGPYIIIFISLCITSWMMYSAMRELELQRLKYMFLPQDPSLRDSVIQERRIHERSQKILKRAFSYLAAFALSFMNGLIFAILTWAGKYSSVYHLVVYFFFPLHGLHNLIVFLWPKVMKLKEENENFSLLQNIIIATRTYDRESLLAFPTRNHEASKDDEVAAPRDGNTSSGSTNRSSLISWLGRSLVKTQKFFDGQTLSIQNKSSGQNTQKSSEKQDVSELESNGLNVSCQLRNESDGLSECESNSQITSCHRLRNSDIISSSESENDDPDISCQSLKSIQASDGLSVGESESGKSSL